VSYDQKHNEANGHTNTDGDNHNLSWNCGVEGPTDDPTILALRERQKRNIMATLLLSQGVPMIRSGDELSHTQHGNNNAYCQDNETGWLNWELTDTQRAFLGFTKQVVRYWQAQPVLHRRKFFQGRRIRGSDVKDLAWFDPSGKEMTDEAWNAPFVRCLAVRLSGDAIDELDKRGERIIGDTLLVLMNAHGEPIPFALTRERPGHAWKRLLDTADPEGPGQVCEGDEPYPLQGRSVAVFQLTELRERRAQGRS
jgi:glycogen operon protein